MVNHTLKVLEYFTILDRLIYHCRSVPGKRRAESLVPMPTLHLVNLNLDLISEMNDIFEYDGGPPSLEFDDLAEQLARSISSGDVLEPKELLNFSAFFRTVHECQRLKANHLKLHQLLDGLVYPASLHEEIDGAIDLTGEIKDSASPELKRLRRELQEVRGKLNERFERYLRSDTSSYLSDNLFTIRDGRYVLPVRETDKGRVRGIIHDRSSSGATFFIEPSETVELNNRHRELETAEREEINRILRHLSEMLYANFDAIKEDVAILGQIDFVAGCTRLSRELHASRPQFSEKDEFIIKDGRHPILLLSKEETERDSVVPLNISLTNDQNILIVTGPNTGGKTVALKTVGILALMASSGLNVPADPKSSFVYFDNIYADIGDEQSIASSLSTYSAHLLHIKTALDLAQPNTLILFDELGAGTDPEEGAAFGQTVIEELSEKGCFAVVTTHQGKLKALAGKVKGVVNGSMEFDREHLRPTFVFQTGVPGSSYAVEIAQKLGFSKKMTDRAWALLDQKERDLTRLITELNQKSIELSRELKIIAADKERYQSLVKISEDKLAELQKSEKESRKKLLRESEEIIRGTRAQLDRLLESARAKPNDREAIREIRKDVSERLEKNQEELQEFAPARENEPAQGLPGEKVFIKGIDAKGIVMEPADSSGRVRVRIGNATMLTDLENLIKRADSEREIASPGIKSNYMPSPGMEIDIRGMTFEEAEPVIERYLDDASNAGLENVSIIHGKGTGMLRKKVQGYLTNNPNVMTFRLGNWNEGSSGVTVVTLRKE